MRATGDSHAEEGQSLVEMALMFPILLLVLTGILDLGRAYYSYLQLTNAAREGARYGATYPKDDAKIKTATVDAAANSNVPITTNDVYVSKTGTSSGDTITVSVNINFQFITAYIFRIGTIPLQNSASMPVLPGAAP